MTKREALIKKIATYQFAAHDLQLYLDTHPGDSATIEQMQRYEEMAAPLIRQYEAQYGARGRQQLGLDQGAVALGMRGGLLMFVYEKKLQYPVNIKTPNAKLAKAIMSQLGGAYGKMW